MGKAIPYDYRVKIVERLKEGASVKELVEEMGYSQSGVKKIWYGYKKEGEEIYKTKYSNCGQTSLYGDEIKSLVTELRDNEQGGAYIRSKLLQKYPEKLIPSERTIQRWWVSQGTNRVKGRPSEEEKKME